jgi:hypothetical protein
VPGTNFSGSEVVGTVVLEPLDLGHNRPTARAEPSRADQDRAHHHDGGTEDEKQVIRHIDLPFAGGRETPAT